MRCAASPGSADNATLISLRFLSWLNSWMSDSSVPLVSSSRMRPSSVSRSSSDELDLIEVVPDVAEDEEVAVVDLGPAVEHGARREQLHQLDRAAVRHADALA